MAMFPVNQNVQWFTPTTGETTNLKKAAVGSESSAANNAGQIVKDAGKVWFTATSGKNVHRSEVIDIKNGGFIKYVAESAMEYKPKVLTITYDTGVAATPINGEVYGIYLNQRGYNSLSERNYMELGAEVRFGSKFNFDANSTLSITAGEQVINSTKLLMAALAQAFERNLGSKDAELYIIDCTANSVIITEKEQDWLQGLMQNEHVMLDRSDIHLSHVTINTIERDDWATVTLSESTTVLKNSKDIADMEWFYLGEHGDQQRLIGYPYANRATIDGSIYHIDGNSNTGYDLIYIHHAYVGNGTFVQKSEQDIIIAVPAGDGAEIALQLVKALGITATTIDSKKVYTF